MIRVFRTTDVGIKKFTDIEPGSWIALTDPTVEELRSVSERYRIDLDDLKSLLSFEV